MLEICEVAGKCELEVTLTVSHLFNTIPSKMWCSSRNNGDFSCIRSKRTNAQHRWCRNTNIDWNLSLCRNPEFEIVGNRTLFKQQYWTQNSLCWIKEYHWIPGAGRWHPWVERRYSRPLSNTIQLRMKKCSHTVDTWISNISAKFWENISQIYPFDCKTRRNENHLIT